MDLDKIYELINNIPITEQNEDLIDEIKEDLSMGDYKNAMDKIQELKELDASKENKRVPIKKQEKEDKTIYPKSLSNIELEYTYMGLLLSNPKYIVKYYFLFDECYFEDSEILNIYKSILFTEGGAYTPEIAKQGFNFARENEQTYKLKGELKQKVKKEKYNMEKIYLELKKLFVLRKNYLAIPIQTIQDKVVEIREYELYDKMSVEEVESAVVQVSDTEKFKRGILNKELTSFLELGDNNLTNGLPLPFPILTEVFKGIRKGETMAFAMPSNAGKSRFTTDVAAHTAFVHHKKVLIISNEMSEEKMKLCLITTILNNKAIQELHGQKLTKTEGELLEFQFRPDEGKK